MPTTYEVNPTAITGSLRRIWRCAGDPTDGTAGTYAGSADPGDLLIDTTNKKLYENMNTAASPKWKIVNAYDHITAKTADTKYLTYVEAGVIDAQTDDIYVYLPTYLGHTGLTYTVKVSASYSAGVTLYPYSASEHIDGAASKVSTAQYDAIKVIATSANGWYILEKVGTWN